MRQPRRRPRPARPRRSGADGDGAGRAARAPRPARSRPPSRGRQAARRARRRGSASPTSQRSASNVGLLGTERVPQLGARLGEGCGDGPLAHAGDLGDAGVGEVGVVAQEDHQPAARRQLAQRVGELGEAGRGRELAGRTTAAPRRERCGASPGRCAGRSSRSSPRASPRRGSARAAPEPGRSPPAPRRGRRRSRRRASPRPAGTPGSACGRSPRWRLRWRPPLLVWRRGSEPLAPARPDATLPRLGRTIRAERPLPPSRRASSTAGLVGGRPEKPRPAAYGFRCYGRARPRPAALIARHPGEGFRQLRRYPDADADGRRQAALPEVPR